MQLSLTVQMSRARWWGALTGAYLLLFVAQGSALCAQPGTATHPRLARAWSVDVAVGGSPLSSAVFEKELAEYGRRTQTASIAVRRNHYRSLGTSVQLTWIDVKSFEQGFRFGVNRFDEKRAHTQTLAVSATEDYEFRLNKQWTLSPSLGLGFVPWTTHASARTVNGIAIAAEPHDPNRWLGSASLTLRFKRFAIGLQLLRISRGLIYEDQYLYPITVGFRM